MPRKAKDKEINEEIKEVPKKVTKKSLGVTVKKSTTRKTATPKTATAKKSETKKIDTTKEAKTTKAATKKASTASKKSTTPKASTDKKVASKKISSTTKKTSEAKKATVKKETTKKTTTKSATKKVTATKKAPSEKTTKTKKTTTPKISAVKKSSTTKKVATTSKASTTKKTTAKKTASTKSKKATKSKVSAFSPLSVLEYYDLPYRYNETTVKVLAQDPNTLFVYWDINDNDRKRLEDAYGEDFFTKTKPVLVVHNITDNYSFEIDINDFANNWYINVDNTKCKYSVELGRRPIYSEQEQKLDYLNVAYSNTIEIPNDHILFFKENDKIYFKNVKTNKVTEKTFKNSLYGNGVNEIYKNYNILDNKDKYDLKNPSSDFLSSNVL